MPDTNLMLSVIPYEYIFFKAVKGSKL